MPKQVWVTGRADAWIAATPVLHWDGTAWSPVSGTPAHLTAISGTGPNDMWALDSNDIYHYDGHWTTSATYAGPYTALTNIWASEPSDVWASGTLGLLLHWDGTSWTQQASGTVSSLLAIREGRYGDVWAVGSNNTILQKHGVALSAAR
jgi:hypothetical protein